MGDWELGVCVCGWGSVWVGSRWQKTGICSRKRVIGECRGWGERKWTPSLNMKKKKKFIIY